MKIYDRKNRRIAVIKNEATASFWDAHWRSGDLKKEILEGGKEGLVLKITRRYLSPGEKILEGGCGNGKNVFGLSKNGYDAYGVDFAEGTITEAKKIFPDLKISVGDVKKLDFPDEHFDGYWSLGVIEHFRDGYGEAVSEAGRVLKKGGYLFLTFPWMSPLRKLKAAFGFYPVGERPEDDKDFYEFIFNDRLVRGEIAAAGFRAERKIPFDAVKGLKDEFGFLGPVFQKIYSSPRPIARAFRYLSSILLGWFCGHIILLVFRKK